jgi:hypothetical protein
MILITDQHHLITILAENCILTELQGSRFGKYQYKLEGHDLVWSDDRYPYVIIRN